MRTSCKIIGNTVEFKLADYQDETVGIGQVGKEIQLISDHFRFVLPEPIKNDPHPDAIALSIVAALLPYIKRPISFPRPVSRQFADSLYRAFGIKVENIDTSLKPRKRGNRTALAFSGGVDSVACTALLPEDTLKFTYLRLDHKEIEPRVDNFRETTMQAVKAFDDVVLVDSDLEYISGPFLQWATWVAVAIPAFLMSEDEEIGDIAFGLVAEGVYFKGKDRYSDSGFYDDTWQALFKAAGFFMALPTVGLTELGNLLIVEKIGLMDKATPCQLGKYQKPCRECAKCFRKDFALHYMGLISKSEFMDSLPHYMVSPKSKNFVLLEQPQGAGSLIVHQEIYMYVFQKILRIWPKPIRLFKKKVLLDKRLKNMNWVVKNDRKSFYRNNKDAKDYDYTSEMLSHLIDDLNPADYKSLHTWYDLPNFYSRADARAKVARLDRQIERAIKRQKG